MELVQNDLLANTVKHFRTELGISQNTIAQALGLSRSAYAYKENGKIMLNLVDLQKLAVVFDFPPELFFHPELLSAPIAEVRKKQCKQTQITSVGDLKSYERDLIGMLRVHRALLHDSDLITKFQQSIVQELTEFYGGQKSDIEK